MSEGDIRCGFCAIVGLPNVGKSTLLNRVLRRHLVAVSAKPQTTRDRVVGVQAVELAGETPAAAQIAFVDTPGAQPGRGPLRRYMRDATLGATADADVVVLVVDASDRRHRTPDALVDADAAFGAAVRGRPLVVALNKIDRVGKPELLPLIEAWARFVPGGELVPVVPICAATGDGVAGLAREIARRLPIGPALFPADHVTDRSPQFVAQEIIREQLYHQLGKELPYACAVQVEQWEERDDGALAIGAVIVVERASQKPIVVGRAGQRVKELGIAARTALAAALARPVHLKLFVQVREEWSRREDELKKLGYGDGA